ncbi:MAG: dTDP-4-dehydrorhamnose reductase, partial [Woeseiaceae bacterium]
MRTLVLGCNGQLGQALAETVPKGVELTGLDLPELDITAAGAMQVLVSEVSPEVIINAAAYTAVDQAESEAALATAVNSEGPRNIAMAAKTVGARLIHVSTDFVFDGEGTSPYQPDAATNPLSLYGRSKRDGEAAVFDVLPQAATVVRTAWLYSKTGGNFVKTMLRLMAERDQLSVVGDQRGTPTWASSLAEAVWAMAGRTDLNGIFHWTDRGDCTWYEFATAIQEEAISLGLLATAIPIHSISTDEYPTAAKRPRYSVLDCTA